MTTIRQSLEAAHAELSGDESSDTSASAAEKISVPEVTEAKISDDDEAVGKDQAQSMSNEIQASPEPLDPPPMWSASAKENFAKMPRELQEYAIESDKSAQGDYTRKTQEVATLKRHYADIDEAVSPYAQQMALEGKSPGAVVRQLLAIQAGLDNHETRADVLRWLAGTYGLNFQQLAQLDQQQQQSPVRVDPVVSQLQQQLEALQSRLDERDQGAQIAVRQGSIDREVVLFADAKDSQGNLAHPMFEQVSEMMEAIVPSLVQQYPEAEPSKIIALAYDKAVAPYKGLIEKEKKAQQDKLVKARAAGSSINGSPTVASGAKPATSMRAAIEQAYEQLS